MDELEALILKEIRAYAQKDKFNVDKNGELYYTFSHFTIGLAIHLAQVFNIHAMRKYLENTETGKLDEAHIKEVKEMFKKRDEQALK